MGTKYAALFLLVLSIYVCSVSWGLGLGKLHEPGAGFIPFWSGVALGVLSILIFFEARKKTEEGEEEEHTNWRSILIVLASLFVYTLIVEYVGFILTTVLFVGFLLKTIEHKRWLPTGIASVAMAVCCYVVFKVWLQAELPRGIFFF